MRIEPIKAEATQKQDYSAIKALSNGFEDAMRDKGRECDYEFTQETREGVTYIYCEIKLDNGYIMRMHHKEDEHLDLSELEREAYKYLLERL